MMKKTAIAAAIAANVLLQHVALAGEFMCVVNEGTPRERCTPWFDNLITDGGLDRIATGNSCVQYGSIGTGTTAPANSNTQLQAYVAQVNGGISDSNSNAGPSTYVSQGTMRYVYAQGAVVGNMTEVGVGWSAGGTNLFSRALIVDGGGTPVALALGTIDQLTVYWRLTMTPTLTDLTGTVNLGTGLVFNYTGRLANANYWNNNITGILQGAANVWPAGYSASGVCMHSYSTQTLGTLALTPAGTVSQGCANNTVTVGSYSAGQRYLDSTFAATPAECNSAGGVGSIVFDWGQSQMTYQYSFANTVGGGPIPKDNTKTLAFTIRCSWDRA